MIRKAADHRFVETVRIEGHIIDSLILPKVLDIILREEARFRIASIEIGQRPADVSWAQIEIDAADTGTLERVLQKLTPHGAVPVHPNDCQRVDADLDGCLPDGFYSTTNLPTEIRVDGEWIGVDDLEMDCGIVFDSTTRRARCVPMHRIRRGDSVVVGRLGVRVQPLERKIDDPTSFKFMTSAVSSEKPKGITVRDIAEAMRTTRREGQKVLLVGGPAIVHTGAAEHVCRLIRGGFVQVLFAGNALATHDIEQSLMGTSLGVHLEKGVPMDEGHEHHLRAINRIRRAGGIRPAVDQGILRSGIMYECIRHGVDFVLAGSIRDDGPLPDVITDTLSATDRMREFRVGVGFCLMVATLLHSIATGNILPASVRCACVDINPSSVTKLADRGTSQSVGIVTDVEPFLRALVNELYC
jgi:lysine-ketoglutarate reductase/saccharopine dehydrogenase-like protein (TIGR00300 family)